MNLGIPHVRESYGCCEDDQYRCLGGEISQEQFGKLLFRYDCHDNDDGGRQTTSEMAREMKACFQEKRLFRIATHNCGNGVESRGRKGLDGEINLYFNIIESVISIEADSTISFMQTISEKPSTTFSIAQNRHSQNLSNQRRW